MRGTKVARLCPGAALLLTLSFLSAANLRTNAQPAFVPPVNVPVTNSTATVFDLSGNYQFVHQATFTDGSVANLTLNFSLAQNAAGFLRTNGQTNILVGSNSVPVTFKVQGRVTGGGGKPTHAGFMVRWQASPTNTGTTAPFVITCNYSLIVTAAGLNGTAQGTAKLGTEHGKIKSAISDVPLPDGIDGTWALQVNAIAFKGFDGTGNILLPNGRTLQGHLVGSFSPHVGLSSFKVAGMGNDHGSAVHVNLFPHHNAPQALSGNVLGQTVRSKPFEDGGAFELLSSNLLTQNSVFVLNTTNGGQSCVECHAQFVAVVSTGFHAQINKGCQVCHGATANHTANPADQSVFPIVDLTGGSNSCAKCHNRSKEPIYSDWVSSAHAVVTPEIAPTLNPDSCGRCHSGSARLALLNNEALPPNPADTAQTCPVCHDPHADHTHTNFLSGVIAFTNPLSGRGFVITNKLVPPVYTDINYNPLNSTNNYFVTTSGTLISQYNPDINLCAQCHNHRGASYTSNSRPPHSSLQYNMLLGTVGVELDGSKPNFPGEHSVIEKQCVSCHMQTNTAASITGHTFVMNSFNVCAPCHGSAANAQGLANLVQGIVSSQIALVQTNLVLWGTTKAPSQIQGPNAWEYINPGGLSSGGGPPTSALQALIPVNIQKARFNLYLVFNDGSLGVHNPFFALHLLGAANTFVQTELNTPND
jgi:hypothetical protein